MGDGSNVDDDDNMAVVVLVAAALAVDTFLAATIAIATSRLLTDHKKSKTGSKSFVVFVAGVIPLTPPLLMLLVVWWWLLVLWWWSLVVWLAPRAVALTSRRAWVTTWDDTCDRQIDRWQDRQTYT